MPSRSLIRGYGLIGAQGASADEVFSAIEGGSILDANRGAPIEQNTEPRVTQLALHAAGEAIERTGWSKTELSDRRTALVVGSSKGPVETWVAQLEGRVPMSPLVGVGESAGRIGQMLQMHGPRLTYAAACASGLHALIQADILIRIGRVDRALVVGCESSLHPIFAATFARMGALSKKGMCRPFDQDRDGFLISEAAAAVCLEAGESDGLLVDAAAFAGDAHHITAMDPDGESLRHVLSKLRPEAGADLVHAHGTGTDLNDPIELSAIDDCFGGRRPLVFSHKASMGHTQGAAGMIGVVLNVMMHEKQRVLPIANLATPLTTRSVMLARKTTPHPIDRSIVLAAGFGGATAAVALVNPLH